MFYRNLTPAEIVGLQQNGCSAEDWNKVTVADPINISRFHHVHFSGSVSIGVLAGDFELPGGLVRHSQISNVTLHNVSVGNGVYINNIANYIANYDIADGVYIDNVEQMVSTLDSTFGLGTDVSVLNETGGREVPLYERLSAQMAYLIAMYRQRSDMVEQLCRMIREHAEMFRGRRGAAGRGARVVNTGKIINVMIGDNADIQGASRLSEGYIAGSDTDPVHVGENVIADGFVMASGSKVDDAVVLHHVFVGQGTRLAHLFSGHDSLFFANCVCENGEAAAIFAGPFTVTMHKSSLLIAGMFSFINAGSGSNQSNHMYKLGPIHQGVVERGSKTTSDSYILWPAKIGAFSLVMGRHVTHPDTSLLPFSYLIENYGTSFLVPGVNLKSVGTIRDAQKWPKRDCRRDSDLLDCINFNLLSPYTVAKMMEGVRLLTRLENIAGLTAARYTFQTMTIESRALKRGREYYNMAIDKFMGNSVVHRLRDVEIPDDATLRSILHSGSRAGEGRWVDIGGMIAPAGEIERLCDDIASGKTDSLKEIETRLRALHSRYYDLEWDWVLSHLEEWCGKEAGALTRSDVVEIVERWRKSVVALDRMLYEDARKEFSLVSRVSFGVDGRTDDAERDFEVVRGDFDRCQFVEMVLRHIDDKNALGDELIGRLTR